MGCGTLGHHIEVEDTQIQDRLHSSCGDQRQGGQPPSSGENVCLWTFVRCPNANLEKTWKHYNKNPFRIADLTSQQKQHRLCDISELN